MQEANKIVSLIARIKRRFEPYRDRRDEFDQLFLCRGCEKPTRLFTIELTSTTMNIANDDIPRPRYPRKEYCPNCGKRSYFIYLMEEASKYRRVNYSVDGKNKEVPYSEKLDAEGFVGLLELTDQEEWKIYDSIPKLSVEGYLELMELYTVFMDLENTKEALDLLNKDMSKEMSIDNILLNRENLKGK